MEKTKKISVIRYIYLYLVTAITIVMIIISAVGLIRLVLNEYVFNVKGYEEFTIGPDKYFECSDDNLFYKSDVKGGVRVLKQTNLTDAQREVMKAECVKAAEENRKLQHANEVKMDLVISLSMLIVAFPLYLIHWGIIRRESKKK